LFQKDSAPINASSSLRRLCALATSKKPPQLGRLGRGGVNLGTNRVKHDAPNLENRKTRIQKTLRATGYTHPNAEWLVADFSTLIIRVQSCPIVV
jgi:hypothetical protein